MKNLFRFNEYLLEANIGDFAKNLFNQIDELKDLIVPFKNNEEGNKFREWVNVEYEVYAKEIDLSTEAKTEDGFKNSYIQKAWLKYGEEYLKKQINK
jgi:hypothetical protein